MHALFTTGLIHIKESHGHGWPRGAISSLGARLHDVWAARANDVDDRPTNQPHPAKHHASLVRARATSRSVPATVHLTPSMGFGFRVSELPQGVGFGFRASHKGWVLGFGFWGPPEAKFWSLN